MAEENQKWDHEPTVGELGLCDGGPSEEYRPPMDGALICTPYTQDQLDTLGRACALSGRSLDEQIIWGAVTMAHYELVQDWAANHGVTAPEVIHEAARRTRDVPPRGHPLRDAAEAYTEQQGHYRPVRDNPQA